MKRSLCNRLYEFPNEDSEMAGHLCFGQLLNVYCFQFGVVS